jgi:hypothetical protein
MYCPKCQTRVYFSFPHSKLVAILSLLLAIGGLLVMRVTSPSGLIEEVETSSPLKEALLMHSESCR